MTDNARRACSQTHIVINKTEIIVRYISQNLNNFKLLLEKLLQQTNKKAIKELSLDKQDTIFRYISLEDFKGLYNELCTTCNIILYKSPHRITDDILKYKLIDEYHNTPYSGHCDIRKTVLEFLLLTDLDAVFKLST